MDANMKQLDWSHRRAARVWKGAAVLLLCLALLIVTPSGLAAPRDFRGARVTFLTERLEHQEVLAQRMTEIARELGIDFRVQYLTSADLRSKILIDFQAGATTWDLVYTGGVRGMYEYAERGVIVPLNDFMNDPTLRDKSMNLANFIESHVKPFTYKTKVMALPTSTSVNTLAYRKDLFESPIERQAFKERYKYDLAPPETYDQFYDVAQFFTRKAGQTLDGKPLQRDFYGANQSNKPGSQLWNDYVNVMMAYGAELYDRKTMRPTWNSKENIEAATFYVSIVPFLHPAHINATSGEAAAEFAAGNVAMMVEYFDRITALCEISSAPIFGKVGYALPPSKKGGRQDRQHAFRMGPPPVGIFANSRNKEAAYKILEQSLMPWSVKKMTLTSTAYIPILRSVLWDPEVLKARPYFAYLKKAADPSVAALTDLETLGYPVILDFAQVTDTANASLHKALTGKATVRAAMNEGQRELEKLFIELGYTR